MKWQEKMHANGYQGCQCVETDPLALQLIELAVSAGWKPRECIEFAREALKFVTSSVSAVGVHQTVAPAKDIAGDLGQPGKSTPDSAPVLPRPKWGSDSETRRKALQVLADRNLTLREAAEILGISPGLAFATASRLNVRFHGYRSRKLQPAARSINAAATPKRRRAMNAPVNGKAVADPAASPRMQRRCLSCNRIFEPAEISQPFCNDCEYGNSASAEP
jgi:hypothetical protein